MMSNVVVRAPIRSLDFSADGNFIMSVDSTSRIKFSEVASGIEVQSPIVFRDEKWATWSSSVGWAVKGFWHRYGCDREAILTAGRSWNKLLLAAGTNGGRIVVAQNPFPSSNGGSIQSLGHAGPISAVSWIAGDGGVVSIGKNDHAIFQWKIVYNDFRESGDEITATQDDEIKINFQFPTDYTAENRRWLQYVSIPNYLVNVETPQHFLYKTDFQVSWIRYLRYS